LGHDYATPGYYFLTFGTHRNLELLSVIVDGNIQLSPIGTAVCTLIQSLSDRYQDVSIDCYSVMPNHIHLLIYLSLENTISISQIVRSIKGPSTAIHRKLGGEGTLWHKGFHDEII